MTPEATVTVDVGVDEKKTDEALKMLNSNSQDDLSAPPSLLRIDYALATEDENLDTQQ